MYQVRKVRTIGYKQYYFNFLYDFMVLSFSLEVIDSYLLRTYILILGKMYLVWQLSLITHLSGSIMRSLETDDVIA